MATSSVDLGKLQLEYNTKAKAFQALQNSTSWLPVVLLTSLHASCSPALSPSPPPTAIQNLVETSQKATGQHNETTMCKEVTYRQTHSLLCHSSTDKQKTTTRPHLPPSVQELSRLPDGAPIYKLTGPLLIRQDRELAKTNVAQRLKLITAQL